VLSGGRAARTVENSRASFFPKIASRLAGEKCSASLSLLKLVALAAILLTCILGSAQSISGIKELPEAPVPVADQDSPVVNENPSPEVASMIGGDGIPQAFAQQTTPPAAPPASKTPPAAQNGESSTTTQDSQAPSGISPNLKGQPEIGKEQVKKEEKQRILGIVPAFNSVYEGKVPPLTPSQKMKLMWKSTTDIYVFGFAAFTAGIGQAQNSHAAYGQGVQGYAKRFGANYADTADGNFWGNAVLPIVMHEDPRYFRLGHGTLPHRILYSMSTSVWCKRDNGTAGPNYANVLGNFISGGVSNLYYPPADRGLQQTVQNALTVTAEGMIGAALIEFWPDIAHHYRVKKQAKQDAADAAARNAQIANPAPVAPQ
jgi:hypothetical protein